MIAGPLRGIRVIELCTGAAGPTVAKCLAEYGAEVLRIESRRHPDTHRGGANETRWNKSPSFVKLHRDKKSVTIDLHTEPGRDLVLDLVRVSDVVVENFSLGVLERWGLPYERLREVKPDIILIKLKGLGNSGPHANHVTWGPNLLCLFGMTYLWNHADSPHPTGEGRIQHPDFMAGVAGAAAVMAALHYRKRTGLGQFIDSAQIEVGASLLGPFYLDYLVNGRDPKPQGNRKDGAAPYGAYPCAGDDRWCVIAVRSDEMWTHFCRAIGNPDWCQADRFSTLPGRQRNREELDRLVAGWTRERTAEDVTDCLQREGVAAGPVQDVEDMLFTDANARDRGLFVELEEPELGPILTECPPVRMSRTPPQVRSPAPLMGEHTREVMREVLSLSEDEISELESEGVLR